MAASQLIRQLFLRLAFGLAAACFASQAQAQGIYTAPLIYATQAPQLFSISPSRARLGQKIVIEAGNFREGFVIGGLLYRQSDQAPVLIELPAYPFTVVSPTRLELTVPRLPPDTPIYVSLVNGGHDNWPFSVRNASVTDPSFTFDPNVTVPNVVGDTYASARQRIDVAGLAVGSVTGGMGQNDRVSRQEPQAGADIQIGGLVRLWTTSGTQKGDLSVSIGFGAGSSSAFNCGQQFRSVQVSVTDANNTKWDKVAAYTGISSSNAPACSATVSFPNLPYGEALVLAGIAGCRKTINAPLNFITLRADTGTCN